MLPFQIPLVCFVASLEFMFNSPAKFHELLSPERAVCLSHSRSFHNCRRAYDCWELCAFVATHNRIPADGVIDVCSFA